MNEKEYGMAVEKAAGILASWKETIGLTKAEKKREWKAYEEGTVRYDLSDVLARYYHAQCQAQIVSPSSSIYIASSN